MNGWIVLLLVAAPLLYACGQPQYVRDTEAPEIDDYTLSTRFDRRDIERLYDDNADKLLHSRIANQWERKSPSPVVAVFPMRNETSEHIDASLDTLLSKIETDLVNELAVDVVSHENQPDLIAEVKRQQSSAYDPTRLAKYGRQLGAQFFVTGKIYDVTEYAGDERRVQYSMFMQVIEVETGRVAFQNESNITKAFMR
jgi:uncharacterized protein (TIGR02722 family)